ncbi:MAG: hypothetical protein GX197_08805 [Firmicutes bacterium]|nr:hypothetical protein [Bacillota bacterium]
MFLVGAAALNLVEGFDNRIRLEKYIKDSNWTVVDMERIQEIKRLGDRIKKWNADTLDITNGLGLLIFLLAAGAAAITFFLLISLYGSAHVGLIFLLDAVILFFPLWFNGTRKVSTQDNLQRKIAIIMEMEAEFKLVKKINETFVPALLLAREQSGKSVPVDARFTVNFAGQPEGFYGLQGQIHLNQVQGTVYPYFYCVIPARKGFGLHKYVEKIPAGRNITVAFQSDGNAEVIVIRRTTTKNTGYHTKRFDRLAIFNAALTGARQILQEN